MEVDAVIVNCAVYDDGRRLVRDLSIEDAWKACGTGNTFVWIGLYEPTPAEFSDVRRVLPLHELAVEDAINAHQRPKAEVYGDSLFVVLKSVRYVDPDELLAVGEILLFVGDRFVVSVRHGQASDLGIVRRSLDARPDFVKLGPDAVLHAILDQVVDDYRSVVRELEGHVLEIEAEVLLPAGEDAAGRIYRLKREVLDFNVATEPFLEPLEALQHGRLRPMGSEVTAYLRDVYDHLVKVVQDIHRFRELLTNAMDVYLSAASARLNTTMKQLTLIASLFLPLTFLTGFFGMNFGYLVNTIGTPLSFGLAVTLMVGSVIIQLAVFKRRGFI
jgi:magnesium transporter